MSDDPLRELDAALGGDLPAALRAAALQFGLTETSAARTPQRNRRVGGAPASFHLEARALDFDGPAFNRRRFHEYIKATYPELAENLLESDHVHLAWRGGTTTMGSDALKELDAGLQVTPPEQVVSEKAGVDEATARAFLESPQAEGVGELVFKSATEAQEEPLRLTTEGTTIGPETEFELSQRREPFPLSVNMADLIEPLEKKEITPEQFVAEAHRRVFIQRFGFTDEQYQEFIRAHNINPFIGVEPGTETPVFAEDAIKRGLRGFADYTVAITPEQYRGVLAGRDELRSFGDLALESVREHAAAIVGGGLGGGLAPLVGAGAGLAQLAEGGIPRAGSPSEVLREAQAGIEQAGAEVTREAGEPSIAKSVLAGATATGLQLPFFVAPELAGPGAGLAPFAAIPGLGALREGPDVALEEAGKGLALGLALKGLGAIEAPTAAQGALRRGIGAGLFAGPAAAEGAPREEVIAQGLLGGVLTPGRGETEAPPSIARELAKIQAKQAGIQPGTEVQRAAQERPVEQGGVGERAGVEAGAAVPADQVQIRGEARPGPSGRGRAQEGREVPETIIAAKLTYTELLGRLRGIRTREDLQVIRPLLKEVFPEELTRPFGEDPWGLVRAIQRGDEIPRVPTTALSQRHRGLIREALRKGEHVPERVLADYPDLISFRSPAETVIEPPAPLPGVREPTEVPRVNEPQGLPRPIRAEAPTRAAETEIPARPEIVPEARPPRAEAEFPTRQKSRTRLTGDEDLVQAIRKFGGIDFGHLTGEKRLLAESLRQPGIFNKRGLGPDEILPDLQNAGYRIHSVDDLLEALELHTRGRRLFTDDRMVKMGEEEASFRPFIEEVFPALTEEPVRRAYDRLFEPTATIADETAFGRIARRYGIDEDGITDLIAEAAHERRGGIVAETTSVKGSGESGVTTEVPLVPRAPQEPPVLKPGERERALPKTLEEAGFEGGRDRVYTPVSNKESLAAADRLITEKGGNEAAAEFLKGQSEPSAEHTAAGMVLIERLGREADAARAANPELATRRDQQTIDLASHMSERLTRMGQGVQAVQTLNLLSPARRLLRNERLAERNLNRSLTVEEARVTRENAAITERTNGRIAELERQVQELLAGKERKRPEGRATFRDRLKTEADAALERINKRLEVERGSGGPSTELIIDYAKYGAFKLTEKGITLADWTADLIQRFGEGIRPFLPEIRRRSRELLMDARRDDFLDRATIRPLRATALEEIAAEVREANKAMLVAAREAKRADREAARQQLSEAKQAERAERQEIAAEARERLKEARALQKEVEQASRREFRAEARAVREAERRAKRFDTPIREQAAAVRDKPRAEITLDDMAAVAAEKLLPGERRGGVGGFARVMTDEFGEVFSGLKRADREKVFQRGMAKVRDAQKAGREAAARRAVTGGEEAAFTEPQIQRLLFERAERTRENLAATNELLALEKRLSGGVVRRAVTEIFGIPRSLMSSIDLPLGRQGLFFAINHPVITAREAVPRMLRAQVVGKTKFESIIAEMKTHPDFELFRKSGGEWTEIAGRGMAEEAFPSTIAQRLPHVRLSEQAFVAGMNAQRLFVFSRFAEIGRSHGYTPQTHPEFFQSIARLSNIGTGRGELPRFLRSSADLLNSLAYSPRFLAARIQLLGEAGKTGASLVGLAKMDPVLRRIQVMEFLKFGATIMTVMGVAKALGAEVTDDFDSADFGKIRVGGFRFDVTGGLGNVVRFGLRLGGQIERRVTGKRLFASQNELKLASDFLETKAAPIPATVLNLLRGEDFKGDPITAKTELVRLVSPMIADDFYQAYQALGPSGLIAASPALLGFGLQVYDGPAPRSDAGKLARLMLIEQIPQKRRTPEEKAASDIRRQIVKELRATGGIESKTLSEQIAAGEITARQERELVRSGGETELQTDFRRLNVKDALEVLRVATPEERAALEDLMLDKLGSPAFGQLDPAEADRIEREVFQLLRQQKKAS